jgi:hypothetical protein
MSLDGLSQLFLLLWTFENNAKQSSKESNHQSKNNISGKTKEICTRTSSQPFYWPIHWQQKDMLCAHTTSFAALTIQ